MKLLKTLTALVAVAISSSAFALTYDFTGGPNQAYSSLNFASSLSVTSNAKVWHGNKGLGVTTGLNKQIDNKNADDKLFLNFGSPVFIRSFTIKGQDGNDRVWTRVDGGSWYNNGIVANNAPITVNQVGQIIRFTQGKSKNGQQGYFLSSITVPDSGATLSILGFTLLGLAAVRRYLKK